MFFFKHPQPFHRKEVAVQIAARTAQDLPETRVIIVETAPAQTKGERVGGDMRTQPGP